MKPATFAHPEALSYFERMELLGKNQRTAMVEYSYCIPPLYPHHWKLTLTGDGNGCTAGRGAVHRYADEQEAHAVADHWLRFGTTPPVQEARA